MAKINGTNSADVPLNGTESDDTINGKAGNDLIYGLGGDDKINAGDGNDTVYGGVGNDTIDGGNGDDFLDGGIGNDTITSGDGNDTVYGRAGDDVIRGGTGNDLLDGGDGNDTITGGTGNDTIYGGAGDDVIKGGKGNNLVDGGDGNDTITGGSGDDTIYGGNGNDRITAGDGNDVIYGGAGDDVIKGGKGNDFIDGGDGNDTITGGAGDDRIYGGAGDDVIKGGKGDNFIDGGSGNDTISGGSGNDTIYGGAGNDTIAGGNDDGTIYGGDGNDTIAGGSDNDAIYGGAGDDVIKGGKGNDFIDGGTGNDTIAGGSGDNTIYGGDGNDTITGGNGNNTIYGGAGNDIIRAGKGNDVLDGGAGDDQLYGGDKSDTFVYTMSENLGAHDVYDGGKGVDTLRLVLTQAQFNSAAVQQDLAGFHTFVASHSNRSGEADSTVFQFSAFDLKVSRIENVNVVIDNGGVDNLPVARTDDGAVDSAFRMTEDAVSKTFNVLANDTLDADAGAPNNVTLGAITVPANSFGIDASDLSVTVDASNNIQVQLVGGDWQRLAATDMLDVTVGYALHGDQPGSGSTANLVVRVTGANDIAVIGGLATGDVTEDGNPTTLTASGALTVADADQGQSSFAAQAATAGSNGYGSFTLDAAGHWTYTASNSQAAVQQLGASQTLTDSFVAVSSDGSASRLVAVTLHGTDDVAVIGGVAVGDVTEDSNPTTLTASGALTVADVDQGQATFTAQASTTGSNGYGSFTLDAAGHWTYVASNSQSAIQQLAAGQSLTDSFTAVSSDGSASRLVTVTLHGTNDAAVIGGVAVEDVAEDSNPTTLTASGALTVADGDQGQATFTAQASTTGSNGHGSFTLDAAGHWTYAASNNQTAIQQLGAGQTLTDSFTAVSSDGSASRVVTVTLHGTDDVAVISGVAVGDVTEDGNPTTLAASGALTVSDADQGQSSFTAQSGTAGSNGYGSFSLDASGQWTYAASNGQAAIQQLGAGQSLTDSFTAVSSDGSASRLVTVTIHGANDVATIGGVAVGDVSEDGNPATLTASGTLTVADADQGQSDFVAQAATAGSNGYGSFTFDAAGHWTYAASNGQAAIQQLGAGQSVTDSFTAVSSDGSASRLVTVTILGSNDAATIGGVAVGDLTEDSNPTTLTASGALTVADVDQGQSSFTAQSATAGSNGYGSFTLDAAGHWTYAASNGQAAIQQLGAGQSVTDSFTAVSSDGSASRLVTVTIHGTNDAATIGGVAVGDLTEDSGPATLTASGALTVADADQGQASFTAQSAVAGSNGYGSFTLDAAGHWTYAAGNGQAAIQQLGAGQSLTDSFTAVSSDGSASRIVTVTIHGTDEAGTPAVIGEPTVADVTEGANVDGSGNLVAIGSISIADADAGQSSFLTTVQNAAGNLGSLTLAADGSYAYSVADGAVQHLGAGGSRVDTFTVTSLDGTQKEVSFTIHGTNDVAAIGGAVEGNVTEDSVPATLTTGGSLTVADADQGQASFAAQAGTAGSNGHGSFTLDAAGNWTYVADNTGASIQQLGAGQTLTDSFTAVSSDGSASQLVTVTIHGTNDAATIGGVDIGDVTEDSNPTTLTASGALTVADADQGRASFAAQAGTAASNGYGSFSLDATGHWTYTTSNSQAAIQQLGAGQSLTDSFTAVSSDGSASQLVTVTLHGADEQVATGQPFTQFFVDRPATGSIANASATSAGTEANSSSGHAVLSADGRYVVFESFATDLDGDTNFTSQAFLHDTQTGATQLVSATPTGVPGDYGLAGGLAVSADGRYVAFASHADNLVAGDTNGASDVFLRDTQNGTTVRVSASSGGIQGDLGSIGPTISSDGRYVAFVSSADNLVTGDTNNASDVFVHDMQAGTTTLVSANAAGVQAEWGADGAVISGDGRHVVFASMSTNLDYANPNFVQALYEHDLQTGVNTLVSVHPTGLTQWAGSPAVSADGRYVAFEAYVYATGVTDVYVRDLLTGMTTIVDVSSAGLPAGAGASQPSISADGRYVSFYSTSSTLVAGDLNGVGDVFVHDMQTGETVRVSTGASGAEANLGGYNGTISGDGQSVAFTSGATDLVAGNSGYNVYLKQVDAVFADQHLALGPNEVALGVSAQDPNATQIVVDWGNGQVDTVTGVSPGTVQTVRSAYDPGVSTTATVTAYDGTTPGQVETISVQVAPSALPQTLVSVTSEGVQANSWNSSASISGDARYVAFVSSASNLDPGISLHGAQAFVHDRTTGTTTEVSADLAGNQAFYVQSASISADGRYVAFDAYASNLGGNRDVFLRDMQTGSISLVSADASGVEGNANSTVASVSADGRHVAFISSASNLVADDTNYADDIFVRDMATGEVTRVSVGSDGRQANGASFNPSISADGRHVAFATVANNLDGDMNGAYDVFVHDMQTGETTLASVDSTGAQTFNHSYQTTISADGRYVGFISYGLGSWYDTNFSYDVYVRDMVAGTTAIASVDAAGGDANGSSWRPSISADGRYVAFETYATNLSPDDTNGQPDIIVHDMVTGTSTRASEGLGGTVAAISANGEVVAFTSNQTYGIYVSAAQPPHSALTGTAGEDILIGGSGTDVLTGNAGTDQLSGDAGEDVLTGGAGNDLLRGGAGSDTFQYGAGFGHDTIGDFTPGADVLKFDVALFADGAAVLAAATDDGHGNTVISVGVNDSVTLLGVTTAELHASDFVVAPFVAPSAASNASFDSAGLVVTTPASGVTDVVVDWGNGQVDTLAGASPGSSHQFGTTYDPGLSTTVTVTAFDGAAPVRTESVAVQVADVVSPYARVSVDSAGGQGDSDSAAPSLSTDGRFVAFDSYAGNLVAADLNWSRDVFVHDAQTGATTLVSVDSTGAQANGDSYNASISGDGRYVAFESRADNLVAGDTNAPYGGDDVFLRDLQTGTTTLVSVLAAGASAMAIARGASISADGRYVAFTGYGDGYTAGDTNGNADIFVRDMVTGTTTLVSVSSDGQQGNSGSYRASISGDGRYVSFSSWADNLAGGDTNGAGDIFVHDMLTGATTRASVASSGAQGLYDSDFSAISADGQHVAFASYAPNLVAGDTNGQQDVFVHDMQTGATTRASVDSTGAQANAGSSSYRSPTISGDGRYVGFDSDADNLVRNDVDFGTDAFVHDMQTGTTVRVSSNVTGTAPALSADGQHVAFSSYGSYYGDQIVDGDTNGVSDVFVVNSNTVGAALAGGSGSDILIGNVFEDTLTGGAGADQLSGGIGGDVLNGGAGNDLLRGGSGSDTFVFAGNFGHDTVTDFTPNYGAGDFLEFQSSAFSSGAAAWAAIVDDGHGNAVIAVDADNSVTLQGVSKAQISYYEFHIV